MPPEPSSPPSGALTGRQRRHLRGLAHAIRPLVQVGEAGISPAVLKALGEALRDHELVKVRLQQPDDKKAAARALADAMDAQLCGVVGHTVILYRRREDDPKIELPGLD